MKTYHDFCVSENNKLVYYMGLLNAHCRSKDITYGKDGIRKELLEKKTVLEYTGDKERNDCYYQTK
jgi:hypothetical protein